MTAEVRVTAKQRKDCLAVILDHKSYATHQDLADAAALAVVVAEDPKTRWSIVAIDPKGRLKVFGPYATYAAAVKALGEGSCNGAAGTRLGIIPLTPAPRRSDKRK